MTELFRQTAVTTDGKPVMAGVFYVYETHGLTLDALFSIFKERGWMVDWLDFYDSAARAGMKHVRIIGKIEHDIEDTWGPEAREHIVGKLNELRGPRV